MDLSVLLALSLVILGFGVVSGRLEKSPLTPPLVFVGVGLVLGPAGWGLMELHIEEGAIHLLAEITLVMILFTDASRIDLRLLKREHDLPQRLLGLGMPLTIVAGAAVAALLFPVLEFWEAAVLAVILAPTDAALGQAVVSNLRVPVRIRQTLNVESGLNDGIAFPVLMLFLCLAEVSHQTTTGFWFRFFGQQVAVGCVVGIAVGWLGGRLISWSMHREWINDAFQRLAALGLALLAFAVASLVGGNGFIAAFCAGLALGNLSPMVCGCLYEFAEAEGQLLTLFVFLILGAVLLPPALAHADASTWIYAACSLTVIHMLPVALSLLGARLRPATVVFLGWFGPRGIASVLFALLILGESTIPHREMIGNVVLITVLLSVVLHGLTAFPGVVWFTRRTRAMPGHAEEVKPVVEMPTRSRFS